MKAKIFLVLAWMTLLAGCSVEEKTAEEKAQERNEFPSDPDTLVLYSIDGTHGNIEYRKHFTPIPEVENREQFDGYPLLGKKEITDQTERRTIMHAINAAIRAAPHHGVKCFYPRHILRWSNPHHTTDLQVCFECENYELFDVADGNLSWNRRGKIAREGQPTLDRILTDAGIPLAPKGLNH
jgi:hypothetical protein